LPILLEIAWFVLFSDESLQKINGAAAFRRKVILIC